MRVCLATRCGDAGKKCIESRVGEYADAGARRRSRVRRRGARKGVPWRGWEEAKAQALYCRLTAVHPSFPPSGSRLASWSASANAIMVAPGLLKRASVRWGARGEGEEDTEVSRTSTHIMQSVDKERKQIEGIETRHAFKEGRSVRSKGVGVGIGSTISRGVDHPCERRHWPRGPGGAARVHRVWVWGCVGWPRKTPHAMCAPDFVLCCFRFEENSIPNFVDFVSTFREFVVFVLELGRIVGSVLFCVYTTGSESLITVL